MNDEKEAAEQLQEFFYAHLTNTWVFNPYFLNQSAEYTTHTINLEDE